jgi:hypothetical protein
MDFHGLAVYGTEPFQLLGFTGGEDLQDLTGLTGTVPVCVDSVALGPEPLRLRDMFMGIPVAHNDVEVWVDDGEEIRNGAEDVLENAFAGARGFCRRPTCSDPAQGRCGD